MERSGCGADETNERDAMSWAGGGTEFGFGKDKVMGSKIIE